MVTARRKELSELKAADCENAGLWLDRYAAFFDKPDKDKESATAEHFKEAKGIPVPDIYNAAYKRWEKCTETGNFAREIIRTARRFAVGMGAQHVLDNGLAMQKVYGVPVIPGSALKGLAAHFCRRVYGGSQISEDGTEKILTCDQQQDAEKAKFLPSPAKSASLTAYDNLFGKQDLMGGVTFHDAWLIPSTESERPLLQDVMTPHHMDYNQGTGWPTDFDKPNPVSFVTVQPGVSFYVVLEGAEAWRKLAMDILMEALENEGVGAKTSSGYGKIGEHKTVKSQTEEDKQVEACQKQWEEEFRDVKESIAETVYKSFCDIEYQRRIKALAMWRKFRKTLDKWKTRDSKKEWYNNIMQWAGKSDTQTQE